MTCESLTKILEFESKKMQRHRQLTRLSSGIKLYRFNIYYSKLKLFYYKEIRQIKERPEPSQPILSQ